MSEQFLVVHQPSSGRRTRSRPCVLLFRDGVESCCLVDQVERCLLTLLRKELGKISAESIEDFSFDARDFKLLRLPPRALPYALLRHDTPSTILNFLDRLRFAVFSITKLTVKSPANRAEPRSEEP